MVTMVETINTTDVQEQVDRYLELHEEMSILKKEMDSLKKSIRGHMDETGVTSIKGAHGKQVYLQNARKSNSTSRYTDYELKDIMPILGSDIKQVTEIRVNTDKLEGLAKLKGSEVVQQVKAVKIVKDGTPRFSVKK